MDLQVDKMAEKPRVLSKEKVELRSLQLFVGILKMVRGLTETAIDILRDNLQKIQGIFYIIEQWGIMMLLYVSTYERSLARRRQQEVLKVFYLQKN